MDNVNYKELYLHLFRGITEEIERLQQLQQETEEMFLALDDCEE